MAEILCGPQVANKFKTVPLSNNTGKDRIDRMAGNVENTLVEKIKTGPFSIQLDETTTTAEEAILIVYCYDPGSYVYFAVLYGFRLCCGSSQPEGGATTIGVSPGAGCRLVQGLEELL